jgi:hypothetical protein
MTGSAAKGQSMDDDSEIERRLIIFRTQYIKSYVDAIDRNFPETLEIITSSGLKEQYFPMYGRTLGQDCSMAAFITSDSLQLFFLAGTGTALERCTVDQDSPQFNQGWARMTPEHIKKRQVVEQLGLDEALELQYLSFANSIVLNDYDDSQYRDTAEKTGRGYGDSAGTNAEARVPTIPARAREASTLSGFSDQYAALASSTETAQVRGIKFEKLWRDVMTFHGWHPKKIGVSGENNDFTAIYRSRVLGLTGRSASQAAAYVLKVATCPVRLRRAGGDQVPASIRRRSSVSHARASISVSNVDVALCDARSGPV